jgi:putative ABC transport system permease protein
MHDLRYALRIARQNPGSTLAAFVALTLGIGATTAIFSVVNSVIVRPLPVKDADRVVRIFETKAGANRGDVSMADYLDWQANLKSFDSLAIYRESQANFTRAWNPERVRMFLCNSTLLPLLGMSLERGRNFISEEDEPGHDTAVILSWPFWKSRFGGHNVLGNKILLDDKAYTIVGVLRSSFSALWDEDVMVPIAFDRNQTQNARGYHQYSALGRLRPGVSLSQADAELGALAKFLASEYPKENGGVGALAIKLRDSITGEIKPVLMMLLGAVTCVLLIACGNVANLLLARASSRRGEVSVRIAMGASRARLFRQLLTESILLSCSAALAGIGLAAIGIRFVGTLQDTGIRDAESIAMDWRVLLFATVIGVFTGVAFGLAPALSLSTTPVNQTLQQSSARVTESRAQQRLRQLLIGLETAVAALLLVASGLLIKSFVKASGTSPGFQSAHLITMQIALPDSRYGRPGTVGPFIRRAIEQIRSIPGLRAAAIATNLPLLGSGVCSILIQGRPAPKNDSTSVQFNGVSPGYFQTMQIPMLSGRDFNDGDTVNSPAVVIVNETLVHRFFAGQNPIGQRLAYFADHPHWKEIVGVVADVRQHGIEAGAVPELFTPLAQDEFKWLAIAARTTGDPLTFSKAIEAKVHEIDPALAVFLPRTMEQIMRRELGWRAFHVSLLIVFASIAITLACIGIYAVVAYSVTQRINEIGVRIALGAEKSDVLRMILWQGAMPALFGAVTGVICSAGMSRVISGLLYAVQPTDPPTYLLVSTVLLVISLTAAYFPARRAASVDPSQALKYQ